MTSLKGKLLLAMPNMGDPRFYKSVIFICSDDVTGTMGIAINKPMESMQFRDLLDELKFGDLPVMRADLEVLNGGPLEISRGFLLHTPDYQTSETIRVTNHFSISSTIESLKSYAKGESPSHAIFALGYAGWAKGQLAQEILDNAWLVLDADPELIFNTAIPDRWGRAMTRHGIDPSRLSSSAGHA